MPAKAVHDHKQQQHLEIKQIGTQIWRESRGAQHRGERPGLCPSAPSSPIQAASSSGDINNGDEDEEERGGKPRWMHEDELFMFVDFTKLVGMRGDGELWSYEVDMVEDSGGWTDREVQMERCGQLSNSNQNVGLETVPGDTNITHPD